ncbi:MAG: hypothetical protein ABIP66_06755 [Gemmatimonadaceae bacterium]
MLCILPLVPEMIHRASARGALCMALLGTFASMAGGQSRAGAAADSARRITRDGVLSFSINRTAGEVIVRDVLNQEVAATTAVCEDPVAGALSEDDVSFVVHCSHVASPIYVNTASYRVTDAPAPAVEGRRARAGSLRNEVIVVGTIHGEHRTSARYSVTVLRDLLRAMRPDFVLTEIAPNRFDAAMREFASTGVITEPRVVRFPEYVDVLFPLTRELAFTIVPTAGWTRPMDTYRTAMLARIAAEPSRRGQWREYEAANRLADSLVAVRGRDDPYFINSAAYDSIQTRAHEPYNRLFNADLGPGGWNNINVAHYSHIARVLDAHRGESRRFVITYGAGHKEWFMRALRERDDITLLDVAPFLEQIGAKR